MMNISGKDLRLAFHIDIYEKDEITGKLVRTNKIKTYSKSEYDTMCYNLSDRIINKYTKLEVIK